MNVNVVVVLSLVAAASLVPSAPPEPERPKTVVFVIRALSRGVTPGASVPPAIADALRSDGFDVRGFEPRAFGATDLSGALRIVGIGVDLSSVAERSHAPLDTCEGVPPASERYVASRDALRARIETLLKALGSAEPRP